MKQVVGRRSRPCPAVRGVVGALALASASLGCRAPPVFAFDFDPRFGPQIHEEHRVAMAMWQQCTSALREDPSGKPVHVIVKEKEDGFADVAPTPTGPAGIGGAYVRLPLRPYRRNVEARIPVLAHEYGHRWILPHTTSEDVPALMSATRPSLVITQRDCSDFCRAWGCVPNRLPPRPAPTPSGFREPDSPGLSPPKARFRADESR